MRRCVVLTLVAGLAAGCGSSGSATTKATQVDVFGDSLLYEARATVRSEFAHRPDLSLTIHATPGDAPCDWLPALRRDLARVHPAVVVIETAGNSSTPCMRDAHTGEFLQIGSAPFYAKYRIDLAATFAEVSATGATTVFVASPPVGGLLTHTDYMRQILLEAAVSEARKYPRVEISKLALLAVSTARGAFTWTKPCLAGETATDGCRNGRITVRDPDGQHFCPILYGPFPAILRGCAVYSSGAVRFGRAIGSVALKFVSSR